MGGDHGLNNEDVYRRELKEKIAATINRGVKSDNGSSDNVCLLLKKASNMLKVAAQNQKNLQTCNAKLTEENNELSNEIKDIQKEAEIEEVLNSMINKGLVSRSDTISKKAELFNMDELAFNSFKEAIENIQPAEKTAGIDSLTFITESNNMKQRKTLTNALDDAVKELNTI